MLKNATKCNKTQNKWCKNKHGASKIIDTFETYQTFQSTRRCSDRSLLNDTSGGELANTLAIVSPLWRIMLYNVRASPAVPPTRAPDAVFYIWTAKFGPATPPVPLFSRIWAFIHPASPGRPRLSEARSRTPDETKTRETASGPAVSARERVVPRH
jgi:hypothetical protein